MKKLKTISKKIIVPAAIVGGVVVVAAVARALSIQKEAGSEDGYEVPAASLPKYIWLELKSLFKFSRY